MYPDNIPENGQNSHPEIIAGNPDAASQGAPLITKEEAERAFRKAAAQFKRPMRAKVRKKREQDAQYRSQVILKTIEACGEGGQKSPPSQTWLIAILSLLDWDKYDEWQRLPDETLARATSAAVRVEDDAMLDRTLAKIRQQRGRYREEWDAIPGNPPIIQHRSFYDPIKKKHFSEYKAPIVEVIREIIDECPRGTDADTLDAAVKFHMANYLERFAGAEKRDKGAKRKVSPRATLHKAVTLLTNSYRTVQQEAAQEAALWTGPEAAQEAGRRAAEALFYEECYKSLMHVFEKTNLAKYLSAQELNTWGHVTNVTGLGPESRYVPEVEDILNISGGDTFSGPLDLPELEPPVSPSFSENFPNNEHGVSDLPRLSLGQTVEDFIAETYKPQADPTRPTPKQTALLSRAGISAEGLTKVEASDLIRELVESGGLPATQKQVELLHRAGAIPDGLTVAQASDKIAELLASGALCDFLSLAELQQFDSRGGRGNRTEQRYCCPLCHGNRSMDADHRSLSANTSTGEYFCHRCDAAGRLREYLNTDAATLPVRTFPTPAQAKADTNENWRKHVAKAQPITGTSGAAYIVGRGIPADVAERAGVKFGDWWKRNDETNKPEAFGAVIFPIKNKTGDLVAAQARSIADNTKRTKGEKKDGVFFAMPGALNAARIAICEAPIDALALAAGGLDAIALCGTSWPEWLPDALAGREVLIAFDVDKSGDEAAAEIAEAFKGKSDITRIRPNGAKDWAEIAERYGLDTLRAQLDFELGAESDEMHDSALWAEAVEGVNQWTN